MENKKYNNPILDSKSERISRRLCVKKVASSLSLLIIGVACIVFAQVSVTDHSSSTYMSLMTIGVIISGIYLLRLLLSNKELVYAPTNSPIENYSVYFKPGNSERILNAIETGNIPQLYKMVNDDKSDLRLDVVLSKDQGFAACQLYRYIPHNYEPASAVLELPAEHISAMHPFVKTYK